MALQKEGVLLAVEGARQFIAELNQAGAKYEQFIGGLEKGEGAADKMGGGLGTLGGAASKAIGALGGVSTAVIAVGAAAVGAVVGVVALGKGLFDLAKATAPIEGLQMQFANLTASFEGGTSAMLSALQAGSVGMISNRDLMQQFNNAASLVNVQFAQRLPEALNLLGKVSMATGEDMSYLMNSLVVGVGRVSPMILDNLKIQVGVAEATDAAAKMFGKEAEALTKVEQQTALTDLVLDKLREKYGALPSAAGTASAQMAIFQANLQNIKDTLGQFILPAFASFMTGVNNLVSAFSQAISEGGSLYPILVNVGAALSILADGFQHVATEVAHWIAMADLSFTDGLGGMAQDAIRWGAEIVTNFAVGMIDAANTVLTWAMQQIQNILMWWLAPGSPPKVAPDLDKWGMAAFESYLQGMSNADFGILERIQSPLKKVLEGPAFADASKAIAKALAGGDRAGAMEILAKSSKTFGDDIAELARREFELADAVTAVEEAEIRLAEAQERAANANKQVSVETATYNRMLREGASKEALDAQLARINAAEREAVAARNEAGAAETGLDAAKDRVDVLKEQVDWQRRFLEQLFGMEDALTVASEKERELARERAAAGAKGGAGGALPEVVAPTGPAGGIGGAIAGAIEDAKQRIKDSLGGIWQMIKTEFSDKWNTAVARLGDTWDAFKEVTAAAWNRVKERILGIWQGVKIAVTEGWDTAVGKLKGVWDTLVTAWTAVRDWGEKYLIPILNDIETLGVLALESAVIILRGAWSKLKLLTLEPLKIWLEGTFLPAWKGVKRWYETDFVPFLETNFIKPWDAFRDKMTTEIIPLLDTKLTAAFSTLGEKIAAFKTEFLDVLNDGLGVLEEWLGKVHEKLGALITRWEKWIKRKKDETNLPESPETPYSRGLRLASEQMERMARVSVPMLNRAMAFQPAAVGAFSQPAGMTTNNYNSAQFTFNTTAAGQTDAAMLEALVLRTVKRALSPGA